jgi:hypothetical protein
MTDREARREFQQYILDKSEWSYSNLVETAQEWYRQSGEGGLAELVRQSGIASKDDDYRYWVELMDEQASFENDSVVYNEYVSLMVHELLNILRNPNGGGKNYISRGVSMSEQDNFEEQARQWAKKYFLVNPGASFEDFKLALEGMFFGKDLEEQRAAELYQEGQSGGQLMSSEDMPFEIKVWLENNFGCDAQVLLNRVSPDELMDFNVDGERWVFMTSDTADEAVKAKIENMISSGSLARSGVDISSHLNVEWFVDFLADTEKAYIEDISSVVASSSGYSNRLEEEMAQHNVADTDAFLDVLVSSAGYPVDWYKHNFGEDEFDKLLADNPDVFDIDSLVSDIVKNSGRGVLLSNYGDEEVCLGKWSGYRV